MSPLNHRGTGLKYYSTIAGLCKPYPIYSFSTPMECLSMSSQLNGSGSAPTSPLRSLDFIGMTLPTDEYPFPNAADCRRETLEFEFDIDLNNIIIPRARRDLFYWAIFIWRFLTNDQSVSPHGIGHQPVVSLDPAEALARSELTDEYLDSRTREGKFKLLEEAKLGPVLVKAWRAEYMNAQEVMREVRELLDKMNVTVVGTDEIIPEAGERWEEF